MIRKLSDNVITEHNRYLYWWTICPLGCHSVYYIYWLLTSKALKLCNYIKNNPSSWILLSCLSSSCSISFLPLKIKVYPIKWFSIFGGVLVVLLCSFLTNTTEWLEYCENGNVHVTSIKVTRIYQVWFALIM
jgi:hypothetical protein